MPPVRPTSLAAAALLAALLSAAMLPACARPGIAPPPAADGAAGLRVPTTEAARAIAGHAAVAEGYALDVFPVRSVERVGPDGGSFAGMWRVMFEHVPPTPPGGHFTVYVDPASGRAQLFHGE